MPPPMMQTRPSGTALCASTSWELYTGLSSAPGRLNLMGSAPVAIMTASGLRLSMSAASTGALRRTSTPRRLSLRAQSTVACLNSPLRVDSPARMNCPPRTPAASQSMTLWPSICRR